MSTVRALLRSADEPGPAPEETRNGRPRRRLLRQPAQQPRGCGPAPGFTARASSPPPPPSPSGATGAASAAAVAASAAAATATAAAIYRQFQQLHEQSAIFIHVSRR